MSEESQFGRIAANPTMALHNERCSLTDAVVQFAGSATAVYLLADMVAAASIWVAIREGRTTTIW
jgi:hypothetical protein